MTADDIMRDVFAQLEKTLEPGRRRLAAAEAKLGRAEKKLDAELARARKTLSAATHGAMGREEEE